MTVQSVMTANPACCTPTSSLRQVAMLMREHDCGQIPVVDGHDSALPLGVITDRDIAIRMLAEGRNPLEAFAGDCMSAPCVTVSVDTSLAECCALMESSKIRRVPVVDAAGRVCGIVSLADVARCADVATTIDVVKEVSTAS